MVSIRYEVRLTAAEMRAAKTACEEYAPAKGQPWKRDAQHRAGGEISLVLARVEMSVQENLAASKANKARDKPTLGKLVKRRR